MTQENKAIYLQALQLAKANNWDAAHRLIQQYNSPMACLIHAYLHRVEGDLFNAGYWYQRAKHPFAKTTLDQEWDSIHQHVKEMP